MNEFAWNTDAIILPEENWNAWKKICSSVTLSATNPTWIGLGSKMGLHSEKPATNCLSYGTTRRSERKMV
jgi:hypothetical protein